MTFSFQRTALSVACASLFSTAVFAEQPLDPLVVSVTRSEQSSAKMTGTSLVITSQELQEKAIQTLPEALDRIAGIPVVNNGGLGSLSSVYIRGQEGKRTLLLVDGVRYNDPSSLQGPVWESIMINDIDRIEVITGGQAGLWGIDSGSVVVNVLTKKAEQGTHGQLSYALGSFGEKVTSAGVSHAEEQFDARISLQSTAVDGFSGIVPIENGKFASPTAFERDAFHNNSTNLRLGVNLSNHQRIELTGFRTESNSQFDGSSEHASLAAPLPNDALSRTHLIQDSVGLGYHIQYGDWQHQVKIQKSTIARQDVNSYDENSWRSNAESSQLSLTSQYNDSQGNWTLGADSTEQTGSMYSNSLWVVQNNAQGSYRQHGVFATRVQTLYMFSDQLPAYVNIGVRATDHSVYDSSVSKSLGVKQMLSQDAYVKMNVGSSLRAPTLNEQYGVFTTSTGKLQPEQIESREISLGWKEMSLTHFDDEISNLIDYYYHSPSDTGYHNVSGTSHLQGWEWRLKQALPRLNTEVRAIYTFLDAKDSHDKVLANRPTTSGTLGVNYLGWSKAVLGIQSQYVGDRTDSNRYQTGHYWLWHANAQYQLDDHWRVFMKGINLTDQRVAQTSASSWDNNTYTSTVTHYYAYMPLTVLAGAEYRF